MSRYTDLASELYQARKASALASMAYSEFIPLRAMVSINPNNVGVKWQHNGQVNWGGVESPGMMWLDVAGFWSTLPLAGSNNAGIFNPQLTTPGVFLTDWALSDARVQGLLPANYVALINALRSIYQTRIFGKGILSSDEEILIRKLLDAGVAVWMMTKSAQQAQPPTRYNPNQKILRSDAFYAAAEAFKPAIQAYNRNNIQQAMADIQASERNVAFWDNVYTTVKFIHELPVTIMAGGTTLALDALWATIKAAWPVLLVGGAAYVGYRTINRKKR